MPLPQNKLLAKYFEQNDKEKFYNEILNTYEMIVKKLHSSFHYNQTNSRCWLITQELYNILQDNNLNAKLIKRSCKVKFLDLSKKRTYNAEYFHVFLIAENKKESVLIDPTYLQYIPESKRKKLPKILIIHYRNQKDFQKKFLNIPIQNPQSRLYWLGFNSEKAKKLLASQGKLKIISNNEAELDYTKMPNNQ